MKSLSPIVLPPLGEHPLISVLVANYNYEDYVGEAVEAVLSQTYQNFELIICDDGSVDQSREIIRRYISDPRIMLIEKENSGQASALNEAFAKSTGEIICLLDSDDSFLPEKLESVFKAFQAHPDHGFCTHRTFPVNYRGRTLDMPIPRTLAQGWVAPSALHNGGGDGFPSTVGLSFRRAVADVIFPSPTHLFISPDGYLARSASFITNIIAIPEPLANYRLHDRNWRGVAAPTVASMTSVLDDFHRNFEAVKNFVISYYNDDIAGELHPEDRGAYWEYILALYTLQGDRSGEVRGLSMDTILSHIQPSRRRSIWSIIINVPPFVSRILFRLWWGKSPLKRYFNFIRAQISRVIG
ncbi:glycosyltransferase family 2 protein [Candidatus Neomarinimicrobiota bacterium]